MPLSETDIRDVLKKVESTQASVQQVSKWITRNKREVDVIAKVWFNLYRTANENLKISLIYVMNDCVQCAKHDKDQIIPVTFHPHIVNALSIAPENVKKPIKRCLEVLKERNIYPAHVIQEMRSALEVVVEDDSLNLDIDQFRKRLEHYGEACNSLDKARKILDSMSFEMDYNNVKIKSKSGVIEQENEAKLMIEKLQKFIASIEAQHNRTLKIIQLNNKAIKYYTNQIKDVNIVYEAYDRFAKGIDSSRSLLESIVKTEVLPGQSPPRDAPSPSPSEDPETEDMQMDEDEKPLSSNPQAALISPQDYIPFPTYNNPPNLYQTSSAPSSSNTTAPRADPRKLRAAPPVANNMTFQQLPPPFFNSPPPQLPAHSFFSPPPQNLNRQASFSNDNRHWDNQPNFRDNIQNGGSDRRRSTSGDLNWQPKRFRHDGSN